jgi:hypothetical protein
MKEYVKYFTPHLMRRKEVEMFGIKKAKEPKQINLNQIELNLKKSRELNQRMMGLSYDFVAQTNQMLATARKEMKRV